MKVINIDQNNPNPLVVSEIAELFKTGAVIAFPTDTFYGLGVDITNERALERIFSIKERMRTKPILILISDKKELHSIIAGGDIPHTAERLMNAFWPGPLTIVFRASESVSPLLTAYTGKIGIRLPDNELCRNIIVKLEHPITATSANIAGEKSLENPEDVINAIGDKIDALIDGGRTKGGYESSVVDVTGEQPVILREGAISGSMINEVIMGVRC
ncbi:MAG: L-threonylcarbamoyladenylate synthase [Nitrospirota bacterium]